MWCPLHWRRPKLHLYTRRGADRNRKVQPILLLSIFRKVFERNWGASDRLPRWESPTVPDSVWKVLLLLLSRSWPYARYADLPPLVIALDNVGGSEFMEQRSTCQSRAAGSFQRLSASFSRYLIDRSLQVAVNRLTEVIFPSETSVSQWPVLGPILLSIYFNNLLQITPHGKCLLWRLHPLTHMNKRTDPGHDSLSTNSWETLRPAMIVDKSPFSPRKLRPWWYHVPGGDAWQCVWFRNYVIPL